LRPSEGRWAGKEGKEEVSPQKERGNRAYDLTLGGIREILRVSERNNQSLGAEYVDKG